MLVMQRAADLNFDLPTRFAALTHDFGKPVAFDKYAKLFQHEQLGIEVIEAFSQRLKVPKKLTEIAKLMSANHTQCHKIRELTPDKLHTFLVDNMNAVKNEARFLQFLNACLCDAQGRGPTMVNNPYPQLEIAKSYLRSLQGLDAKQIVKNAIAKGITGKQISDEIRIAEIDNIRAHQVVLSSN
jgi:tRNA nucleotidyltransferase (CCA-adding enzyme)